MSEFTDDEIKQLRNLLEDGGAEKLREFLKYSGEFEDMMMLRGARALVWRTSRQLLLGTAGLITASVLLWDQFKILLRSIIQ